MTDEPTNLVLEQFRVLRAEMQKGFAALHAEFSELRGRLEKTDRKVGDLAQGMVGLRHQLNALTRDVQMFGVATEAHTQRLDRIEARLGMTPDPNLHDA